MIPPSFEPSASGADTPDTALPAPVDDPGRGHTGVDGPVIRTVALTKRYGSVIAVDGLDLEVHRGEVFGLLGPNGAGKTTTILMLLGLTEPTSGEVEVLGFDPARRPRHVKRRVGYLPDAVGFYDDLTALENLRYTAELNALPARDLGEHLTGLLRRVGLSEAAHQPVGTFSRGMRQRLGIADALVKDPQILVMDEPTIAIDPRGVEEVLELVRWLRDERGVTVLLSSHLLHQVEDVCDRVGLFVRGRLVASGPVPDLAAELGLPDQAHPLDEIYRRYFSAADSTGTAAPDVRTPEEGTTR